MIFPGVDESFLVLPYHWVFRDIGDSDLKPSTLDPRVKVAKPSTLDPRMKICVSELPNEARARDPEGRGI